MPDICMCTGGECTKKKECFRYRVKPDMYQTYYAKPPYDAITCECKSFVKLKLEDGNKMWGYEVKLRESD